MKYSGQSTGWSKITKVLKSVFTTNKYFETLFPWIKEQKPGVDFYAVTAIIQLITIVFLIFFYTQMDPNYTNNTA